MARWHERSCSSPGSPDDLGRPVRAPARRRARRRPGRSASTSSRRRDDIGGAEFVRADIRNPVIAKVIAQAERRHRRAHERHRDARAAPAAGSPMKEINVIGTMQLLAACQKAPERAPARREVDRGRLRRRRRATRRCSPRTWSRKALPRARLRQGLRRGRGLRARASPGAGPTSTVTMLRFANIIGPGIRTAAHRLLRAAGGARPCSASTPRLQFLPRGRRARARCGRATARTARRHRQRRRRRRPDCSSQAAPAAPADRRCPVPRRSAAARSAAASAAPGWPTSRPSRCGSSTYGRGARHHPDARRCSASSPRYTTARGVRRLRRAGARTAARERVERSSDRRTPAPTLGERADRPARRRRRCADAGSSRSAPATARPARRQRRRDVGEPRPPTQRPTPVRAGRPGPARRRRRLARPATRAAADPARRADAPTGDRRRRRPARPASATDWERELAGALAFLRRRLTGDYEVDEFGFDPELTEHVLLPPLRPLYEKWFRVEIARPREHPGRRAARWSSPTTPARSPLDALMTAARRARRPPGAPAPADARRRPGLPRCRSSASWPARPAHTLACNADAERLLSGGELVGVWPEGFKGIGKPFRERYKLQRFGRGGFVVGGAAHRRADHPVLDRRRRGDLPDDRQRQDAGPAARPAVRPDHADVPAARPARRWSRCRRKWIIEFGEPIQTDALRPGARRTTRCSSSTSPTRCARRSSRRSTGCSCSAARLLLTPARAHRLDAVAPALRRPRRRCVQRRCRATREPVRGRRRRSAAHRRPPADAPTPGDRGTRDPARPCGRCGSRGSASRAPGRARAARRPG